MYIPSNPVPVRNMNLLTIFFLWILIRERIIGFQLDSVWNLQPEQSA